MKHFILPFPEQENKLKPKFGVRAINTKRPRQQLSSRAKISKVEREKRRKSIQKNHAAANQPTSKVEAGGRRHHHPWQLCCWQHSLEKVPLGRAGQGIAAQPEGVQGID